MITPLRAIATAFVLYGAWRMLGLLVGSAAIAAGMMPNRLLALVAVMPWAMACIVIVLTLSTVAALAELAAVA